MWWYEFRRVVYQSGVVRTLPSLGGLIFKGLWWCPSVLYVEKIRQDTFSIIVKTSLRKMLHLISKWIEGCDTHFCNAHLFRILLIVQQSIFLKCWLKNTTDPITINLNYLSVQVLYQFCTQDIQNIWHYHFTWSLLFFNINFPWNLTPAPPFGSISVTYPTPLNKGIGGFYLVQCIF